MRGKSDFTKILEEKIVVLRGRKVKVSLVLTKTKQDRDLIRTYSNFLKNDNEMEKREERLKREEDERIKNKLEEAK